MDSYINKAVDKKKTPKTNKQKNTKKLTVLDNEHFINLKSHKFRVRVYQKCKSLNVKESGKSKQ